MFWGLVCFLKGFSNCKIYIKFKPFKPFYVTVTQLFGYPVLGNHHHLSPESCPLKPKLGLHKTKDFCLSPLPASGNLRSIFCLYKFDYVLCRSGLLSCLFIISLNVVYFTWPVFRVHPGGSLCQTFLPFEGCVVAHWTYGPHLVCLSTHWWWALGRFYLLAIANTAVNTVCKHVFESLLSDRLGFYPEVELLDHPLSLCLFLREHHTVGPSSPTPHFTFPPAELEGSSFSTSSNNKGLTPASLWIFKLWKEWSVCKGRAFLHISS